jgi:hypothetical protein
MPKQYKVQAPDGQIITLEGPEGASPDEVIRQAQRLYKPPQPMPERPAAGQLPLPGALGRGPTLRERAEEAGVSGLLNAPTPLAGLQIREIPEVARGSLAGIESTLHRGGQLLRNAPVIGAALSALPSIPYQRPAPPSTPLEKLGYAGEQAAEFMAPGPLVAQLGRGANLLTRAALEGVSSAGMAGLQGSDPTLAGTVGAAMPVAGALAGGVARKLYQSTLKPSTALSPEEARAVVETGLREQIPITRRGQQKLTDIVNRLSGRVRSMLDPNVTIPPSEIVAETAPTRRLLERQSAPEEELAAFDRPVNEFLARHQISAQPAIPAGPPQFSGILDPYGNPIMRPGSPARPAIPAQDIPIPSPTVQDLKTGTYARTYERTGEQGLTSAGKMGHTSLARGERLGIERRFPDVIPLNERMSQLLQLQPELQPAINRLINREIIGIRSLPGIAAGLVPRSQFAIALEAARRPYLGRFLAGAPGQLNR